MVDATTWEILTQIIALIGVPGVLLGLYKGYAEITNIKKTRQAQLFMQIYDHMNDTWYRDSYQGQVHSRDRSSKSL